MEEDHKPTNSQIVLKIFEEGWQNQNFDKISEYISEDTTLHIRQNAIPVDLNGLISVVDRWKQSFPDLRFEVLSIIEQDDMVATNMLMKGTHKGIWREIEPTGRRISVPHMFFFRFENQILLDIWEVNDFTETEENLRNLTF